MFHKNSVAELVLDMAALTICMQSGMLARLVQPSGIITAACDSTTPTRNRLR
jgi:hypothetical protein